MTAVGLPAPVVAKPAPPDVDLRTLERELRRRVDAEVRFDATTCGAYSTDGSNYRQVPLGVVIPRSVEAAVDAVAVCREHGAPLTSRGGGTSLAGQTTNTAVILDFSKYCDDLLSVDEQQQSCLVEPGIVLDELNEELEHTGLRFGPEPATHTHCTLGGMIGNNSCGATAQWAGKTVDNVLRLEILTYDGLRMWVGPTSDEEYAEIVSEGGRRGELYAGLRALRDQHMADIRLRYPDIPRRVSGYNLDSLLPENGFNVAQALVGSEGTLVVVLRAELKLLPRPKKKALVVLGYPNVPAAADAVPKVLPHKPIALEGIDDRLVNFEKAKHINADALAELPDGAGWLLVQFAGDTQQEADQRAKDLIAALEADGQEPNEYFYDDPEKEARLWKVREAGLGATARVPNMPDTWEGWEDSAVPPDRLGDYLREMDTLYDEFGYSGSVLYGHFGHGCVHTRIPFDLVTADGVANFRRFIERAADVVVSYGGSFSGEHGDGQARAELLPKMFGDDLVRAFGEYKALFDPDNKMNPGKVAAPYAIDENLRLGAAWRPWLPETVFQYPDDDSSFQRAVTRCVGVGNCRQQSSEGSVMCPSYQVTREEVHSTRGRSRLLFEMLNGHPDSVVKDGWRSEAVLEALDLCLACKGCKKDCPVDVDMATYKAEFLHHHYAGRLRPRAHYAMGWLPLAARIARRAPRLVNALTHAPVLAPLATKAAGVDPRREVPRFAEQTFQSWFASHEPKGDGARGEVLLWPDTFTNHFHPSVARSAVEVLEHAGWRVTVPTGPVCCGLTWISTGQLTTARHVLNRTIEVLRPALEAGTYVVGLEPSCTAVFRSDAHELFPQDLDVQRLRKQTVTLAELLHEHTPGWRPPQLHRKAIVQTHCHQHAVMGFDADKALLAEAGLDVDVLDSGCCGLAGNFGFEAGHYEVSEACAERVLFPALRDSDPSAAVLADGFSCRTQIEQGDAGGREGIHLAELLAGALHGNAPSVRPESAFAERPPQPSALARAGALVGVGAVAAAAAVAAATLVRRRR